MSVLKCPACPVDSEKRYDTSQLQDHIGLEHLDGFYTLQCSVCSKTFNSAYRGYAHMKLKCKMDTQTDIARYMEPLLLQDGKKLKEMNKMINDAVKNYAQEVLAEKEHPKEHKTGFFIAPEVVEAYKQKQKAKEEASAAKEPVAAPPSPPKKTAEEHEEQVEKPRDAAVDTSIASEVASTKLIPPPPPMSEEHRHRVDSRDVTVDVTIDDVASEFGNMSISGVSGRASTLGVEEDEHREPRRRDLVLPPTIDGELYDDDQTSGVTGCHSLFTMESDVFYPDPTTPYHGVVLTSPGKQAKYNVADTLYLIDKNFGHSMGCYRNRLPGCCPVSCNWLNEVARLITQEDGFYRDAVNFYSDEARKIQIALGFDMELHED